MDGYGISDPSQAGNDMSMPINNNNNNNNNDNNNANGHMGEPNNNNMNDPNSTSNPNQHSNVMMDQNQIYQMNNAGNHSVEIRHTNHPNNMFNHMVDPNVQQINQIPQQQTQQQISPNYQPGLEYPTNPVNNNSINSDANGNISPQQMNPQRYMMRSVGDISQPHINTPQNMGYTDPNLRQINNTNNHAMSTDIPTTSHNINNNMNNINSYSPSNSVITPAKKRVSMACDHCRKRKIKCGPVDPSTGKCDNCIRYDAICSFHHRDQMISRRKTLSESEIVAVKEALTANNNSHMMMPSNKSTNNKSKLPKTPGIIKKIPKITPLHIDPNLTVETKMDTLDKKVSNMIDNMARMEWLLSKIIQRENLKDKKNDESSTDTYGKRDKKLLPKFKYYNTSVLTATKLQWVKKKTVPELSDEEFVSPLTSILTMSLKWYVIQNKNLIDFSSPTMFQANVNIFPLPPKEQSKRLLENFHNTLISSATGLITLDECFELMERYFDDSKVPLTYPDSLLLNVCLCAGANATEALLINEADFVRKDRYNPSRSDLAVIENNMLLNAMYYYHKLSMLCSGMTTVQALLLFTRYLADNLTTELADDVLTTAIKFAVDMRLGLQSYYSDISNDEYMVRRRLWWHCFCIDKKYSLILSRPPLLHETEMDMLTDENYCQFIRIDVLPKISDMDPKEIEEVHDIKVALNAIVGYCEFIPYFLSYFIYRLVKIEMVLFETCFSSNMTTEYTFEDTMHKVIEVQESLVEWKDNLHTCMRLDTYKQYLCMLFTKSKDTNPALSFEIACSKVINTHFRHLYLVITLNLFTLSFLHHNFELSLASKEILPTTVKVCSENYKNACVEMLETFLTTKYHPHRFNESMYHLFTGIYVLILTIIKHMDDPFITDIEKNITLLETCHKHLLGENYEFLETKNVKWQVSVYFFTFLMKYMTRKYHEIKQNSGTNVEMDSEYYDKLLSQILEKTTEQKRACCVRLYDNVKNSYEFKEVFKDGTLDDLLDIREEDNKDITVIDRNDVGIFNELTPRMLQLLHSDKPFTSQQILERTILNSESLFPVSNIMEEQAFPMYNSNSSTSTEEEKDMDGGSGIKNFLPFGDTYFDREFYFMEIFKANNSR
ncbi:halotolerance protein 9 [Monosporozyma unispora]|nr:hypothetical protein C6P44_002755 [Kazachstania unispora]